MTRVYGILIALGLFAAYSVAIYMWGSANAADTARLQQLQAENDQLLADIEQEQLARKADAIQAKIDREEQSLQDLATQELIDALTDRARVCFDAGDADRLRDTLKSP